MSQPAPGLLDRTLRRFRRAWGFSPRSDAPLEGGVSPDLPEPDLDRVRRQIAACLEERGGEVSARQRAATLGETYLGLNPAGRQRFLELLASEYDVRPEAVDEAVAGLASAADTLERRRAEQALRAALEAPRVRLLRQFNSLSRGVEFLVDLRAELMQLTPGRPSVAALDRELHALLVDWFDVGFLDLRRITWETPAALLERLIEYEAVHAIRSWEDLKHRLAADRRCYAFFHPRMPEDPLIFVQVALVNGMASSIQELLDESAPPVEPDTADTAIFYSISNCHRGLAGVSFGSFLIKRVVDHLARELPRITQFATLSPVPGLRRWLDARLDAGDVDPELVAAALDAPARGGEDAAGGAAAASPVQQLRAVLDDPTWPSNAALASALEGPLRRLCARYLLEERRNGHALDRVARFHLSNGARIERINWLADTSPRGLSQSAGLMVNYRYLLADIERNHEAYRGEGRVVAASAVRKLLKR